MNVLGIGPLELMLIVVLALIFLGPEELPTIMRKVGAFVRELQELTAEVSEQMREELGPEFDEVTRAAQEIQQASLQLKKAQQTLQNPASVLLTATIPSVSSQDNAPSNEATPTEVPEPPSRSPSRKPLAPPDRSAEEDKA